MRGEFLGVNDRAAGSGVGIPRAAPVENLTSSERVRRLRGDTLHLDRAHQEGRRCECDEDADYARADVPIALLALTPATKPPKVARLKLNRSALAFEGVGDPRHPRPPSPCGRRRVRDASATGSWRP